MNDSQAEPLRNQSLLNASLAAPPLSSLLTAAHSHALPPAAPKANTKSLWLLALSLRKKRELDHIREQRDLDIERQNGVLERLDVGTAIVGLIGLALAIAECETFAAGGVHQAMEHTEVPTGCQVLRWIVSATTAPLVVAMLWRAWVAFGYGLLLSPIDYPSSASASPKFLKSSELRWGIFEAVIDLLHCPPSLTGTVRIYCSLRDVVPVRMPIDSILTVMMLLRVYLFFRLLAHLAQFRHLNHGERTALDSYLRKDRVSREVFELKAFYAKNPFRSLVAMLVLVAVVFGYAIRAFERPLYPDSGLEVTDGSYQDYSNVWNGIWLTFVSMSTVGYGDLFPRTHIGRGLCIAAVLIGITLFSLLTVAMGTYLTFTQPESIADSMIRNCEYRKRYRLRVVQYLQRQLWIFRVRTMKIYVRREVYQAKLQEQRKCMKELIGLQRAERAPHYQADEAIKRKEWLLNELDEKRKSYKCCVGLFSSVCGTIYTRFYFS